MDFGATSARISSQFKKAAKLTFAPCEKSAPHSLLMYHRQERHLEYAEIWRKGGALTVDVRAVTELCHRLDELARILDIMEGDQINADLHREASAVLRDALGEIQRLRSDADLHRETSSALRHALVEIKRLKTDADLHHTALRDALGEIESLRSNANLHREPSNTLRDAVPPTDWVTKFLERKRALTGRS
jgi:hypothetical protein